MLSQYFYKGSKSWSGIMNTTRTTLLFLSLWVVIVAVIYFTAFWPGNQCDVDSAEKSSLVWESGENTPWFRSHLEFYPRRNLSTLKLLHILVRHGDRTNIINCKYPNDPYGNETYAPFGWGSVTNVGKRRVFEVGRALRHQYGEFLGDYDMDFHAAVSSELPRCRNSLALILAGLFPPSADFTWMHGFNWQPIKYDVNTGKDNMLGNPRFMCAGWQKIYEEAHSQLEEVMSNHSAYFDWLQGFTGWDRDLLSVNMLYHSITVNLDWRHKLDQNFEAVWPEPTTTLNNLFWTIFSRSDDEKRAGGGLLMQTMLEHSKEKVLGNHVPKLHLYSGSDYTLVFMLSMLGQEIDSNPAFGAHLVVELHNDDGMDYFKFFYRDDVKGPAKELLIPNCTTLTSKNEMVCPFNDFQTSMMHLKFDPTKC